MTRSYQIVRAPGPWETGPPRGLRPSRGSLADIDVAGNRKISVVPFTRPDVNKHKMHLLNVITVPLVAL